MTHNYLTFDFQGVAMAISCNTMDDVMIVLSLICTLREASGIKVLNTLKNATIVYTFNEFKKYIK